MQGVQEKGFCSGKKIFSYIGRIPVKIAGNQIQQVSNSQYCGRFHYQENIQFCRQARGSLDETLEHLVTAFDEGYIPGDLLKELNTDYKECKKQLNGYIKYLRTAKQEDTNNK